MPVLTKKEYNKKVNKGGPDNGAGPPSIKPLEEGPPKEVLRRKTYVLFHPENPKDHPLSFEDEIILEGKSYKRICIRGTVKTKDEPLYLFLKSKGYEVIEILED